MVGVIIVCDGDFVGVWGVVVLLFGRVGSCFFNDGYSSCCDSEGFGVCFCKDGDGGNGICLCVWNGRVDGCIVVGVIRGNSDN